jgi:hypothetical protein
MEGGPSSPHIPGLACPISDCRSNSNVRTVLGQTGSNNRIIYNPTVQVHATKIPSGQTLPIFNPGTRASNLRLAIKIRPLAARIDFLQVKNHVISCSPRRIALGSTDSQHKDLQDEYCWYWGQNLEKWSNAA